MTDIPGNCAMVELDEEPDKELEYLVTMREIKSNPIIENPRKALRLRMRNKTYGWAGETDSNLDSLAAEARNTAEWKIYDAVEGIDL